MKNMEPKFINDPGLAEPSADTNAEEQETNEDNIVEGINAEEENKTEKDKNVKGLLKQMENKITNISEFTGISQEDVLEMTGLEYDIMEQLDNPDKFADKVGGVVEYLNNASDDDIELYMNHFDDAMASINPKENPSKILKFASEHHVAVKLGFIVFILASLAPSFAESASIQDLEIDCNGETLLLGDLMENKEFGEATDAKLDIPIDVLQSYSTEPLSNEDGFAVNFAISETGEDGAKVIGASLMGTYDVQGEDQERQEDFVKINDLLLNVTEGHNYSNNAIENKMTMEEFGDNKEKLVTEIAEIMNISEEEVSDHFDKLFEAVENPTEKVSVVALENFNIDENFEPKGEVQEKYEEIENKYNTDDPEEREKMIKEFELWGEENGYENVYSALSQENLDNPFAILESHEGRGVENKEIYGKFIVNELEERGYDIKELQGDSEKAVEAIYDFTIERQGIGEDDEGKKDALRIELEGFKNLQDGEHLDNLLSGEEVEYLPHSIETFESDSNNESFREELITDILEKYGLDVDKLNEISGEDPNKAISMVANLVEKEFNEQQGFDGSDQSSVFMGIKDTLEEMGVKNFDKFVVTQTTAEDGRVVSQLIAPTEEGEFRTTSIDFSSIGAEPIAEEDISEKVEEAHNSVLNKIRELNVKDRLSSFFKGEK